MPEISPSKYLVQEATGLRECWHAPDRTKTCIMCRDDKPLSDFYCYQYTTNQGRRSLRYESRCLPCARARRMEQYNRNPDVERQRHRDWCGRNSDHLTAYRAQRQQDELHKANKAKAQRMRSAKMRAAVSESNDAIRAIYELAIRVEQEIADCPVFDIPELGKKIHVDHIIPVSKGGAHVAENLQLLPAGINMRKGASCPR